MIFSEKVIHKERLAVYLGLEKTFLFTHIEKAALGPEKQKKTEIKKNNSLKMESKINELFYFIFFN